MLETSPTLTDEEIAELRVRAFTLPLNNMTLLLPSTVVAEVLDYREAELAGHMPEWFLGMLLWRGRHVPLFRFEKLIGREPAKRTQGTRHIVCNTLNGSDLIPFIAIEIDGMPQLHMITQGMLTLNTEATDDEPVVQAQLRLDGESVIVPDLDVMENMLQHLGISTD